MNRTFTYKGNEPPAARQVAYAKKLAADPDTKTGPLNAASCSFYDFLHLLKVVADDQKGFDSERLKKGFDSIRNYAGMIGPVSFTPENHCALNADAIAMVSIASGKDPRSMGFFRERI
jgi:hypothetical protein